MANITIQIPDAQEERVLSSFWDFHPRPLVPNPAFNPAQPESEANPRLVAETYSRRAWAKACLVKFVRDNVQAAETRRLEATAKAQAPAPVEVT